MSETYPPDGDQGQGVPPVPEPPHDAAAFEGGVQPPTAEQPASAPVTPPPYAPEPSETPSKPKLHWGFAALGFFTPWLLSALAGAAFGALATVMAESSLPFGILSQIPAVIGLLVFIGMLVAWQAGRGRGDNRLRSFGLGGVVSYAVILLLGLLAFGACFLLLGTGGLGGN